MRILCLLCILSICFVGCESAQSKSEKTAGEIIQTKTGEAAQEIAKGSPEKTAGEVVQTKAGEAVQEISQGTQPTQIMCKQEGCKQPAVQGKEYCQEHMPKE